MSPNICYNAIHKTNVNDSPLMIYNLNICDSLHVGQGVKPCRQGILFTEIILLVLKFFKCIS